MRKFKKMILTQSANPRASLPEGVRRKVLLALLFITVVALFFGGSIPARATSARAVSGQELSSVEIDAARSELLAGSLPRTTSKIGDITVDTFELREGTTMSISRQGGKTGARLGAGTSPSLWIKLNRIDQQALANGSAGALGIALCAIPAVGWAACAGIVGVLAIALTYVHAHGLCPKSKPQLMIFIRSGVFGCVKS